MGTTFSSIHVYGNEELKIDSFEFRSFSEGWQTCINDFSEENLDYFGNTAKLISKKTSAPVLWFYIFDDEAINFAFFKGGRKVAQYSDDEWSPNKNLSGIPAMIGYGDGYKKRLSNILGCGDAFEKMKLLEEYFGVCLLPFPELLSDPDALKRERGEELYNDCIKKEKTISAKKSPVSAKLIIEYKGKIFQNYFDKLSQDDIKEHCYLYGYETEDSDITPVRFVGERLEKISKKEFNKDRVSAKRDCAFYEFDYKAHSVTFNDKVPEQYVNKTVKLPNKFYPLGFDSKNRLILQSKGKLAIADENMNIIATMPIKGEACEVLGDYVLVTSGFSFYAFVYDSVSVVRIYKLIEK